MKFLFLMDPLETVNPKKDTSFAFMVGANKKGHEIYFLPEGGISKHNEYISFSVTKVVPSPENTPPFEILEQCTLTESEIDAVFIRTDPPFDEKYLMQTWLLDLLPKNVAVINSPNGIRTANEKIWATQFKSIIPKTIISQSRKELFKFIDKENRVIAKPTGSFGGQSIFLIDKDDTNANVILETLTSHWSKEIILQQYIPEADKGDKRILLLNGEPLGAVLRVHSDEDHRNNFFAGGKANPCEISARDNEIIDILKPHLIKLGLYFVGIDIIGDYLIEVNVTSPTCLQEINRFQNTHLEDKVIQFVEKLVDQS